jgi:hypothetical protein
MNTAYFILLMLNALWFGSAFWYFSIKSTSAAKVLVPPSARESPLFPTIVATVKFLGGMNAAFALFSLLVLFWDEKFPQPLQKSLFTLVFAAAHGSQFIYNVPIARMGGRQGESYWNVLSGPMLFIFVVDATLAAANLVSTLLWLLSRSAI